MRVGAIWVVFVAAVSAAGLATARLGATALAVERAEAGARRQAEREENVQRALWRMESSLAPLMAEESARPYFAYTPLYPAERAFTCMFAEIKKGDVLVPSPLLTAESPRVRLHFQFGPDGRLTSPRAPAGNLRDLAEARYLRPGSFESAAAQVQALGRLVTRDDLAAALGAAAECVPDAALAYGPSFADSVRNDYAIRSRNAKLAQSVGPAEPTPRSAPVTVSQGPLHPVWVGPALVLARRVRVEEGTFFQGCWLDWDVIRRQLLADVADLLPGATLEPVPAPGGSNSPRMLASLPARLVPSPAAAGAEPYWSPVRLSLAIAWGALVLVAVAVGVVLRGALALSERRGTFVSAVTHELRTPLTTFRLYTEMLDEGMVADPAARRSYVKTLRAEADRLGHLVENVLAFARLERGRGTGSAAEALTPAELLGRVVPRLAARARQAGMELVVAEPRVSGRVRVDPTVVDQVLSNLVDNAVKYAGAAADRRILLDAAPAGRWLTLTVRDHGPGLSPTAVRRLFRPFSKSAHDAAQSAPGVGLGLALSRRLARAAGGDLRLADNGPAGAAFVLTVPFA